MSKKEEVLAPAPDAAPPETAAPKRRKKLIVIGAVAAVLLAGGGGGAALLLSGDEKVSAEAEAEHGEAGGSSEEHGSSEEGKDAEAFVDVPPLVVNLRSADGAPRFLKVHFMLVPGSAGSSEALKEKLPLLLDAFQPFLRELRPEDLGGAQAVYRVKEAMLVRAHEALGNDQVKDVLVQDLVQQ